MIKLNFNVDKAFDTGIARVQNILGFEIGDGISVNAVKSDKIGVTLSDKKATIYYNKKHIFFRELRVLCENAAKRDCFEIFEDTHFETVAAMIDVSRREVLSLDGAKKMLDHLVLMGYGLAMLYTEDLVELEGRPFFGYMRGKYSVEDLRTLDDYAYEYGIEMIPCIECYGHMKRYLHWSEARDLRDTGEVLLARSDKTFEFLEELISTVSSAFRSKRIHIGMDEANDMGRGKFLDKNGYVPPFDIFNEYMERLIGITNKYGLTPMMWSDMYFRISSATDSYYDTEAVVPDEVIAKIPEGVELVFWHYGDEPKCDDKMLENHAKLGKHIIFAGGMWSWIGHFPENRFSFESSKFSLEACRRHGVREAIATLWLNDADTDFFTCLLALSNFAELCYDENIETIKDEKLSSAFEASTGGIWEAFFTMGDYQNDFETKQFKNFGERFLGKHLFYNDVLEGLYDSHLYEHPMSPHYASCAKQMAEYTDGGRWDYLYRFAEGIFDLLALKTFVAENLAPAYKRGDRETLAELYELLPTMKEKAEAVRIAHRDVWMRNNKAFGWINIETRYGALVARIDTAIYLLGAYLSGEIDELEELAADRLHLNTSGYTGYLGIAIPAKTI